MMEQIVTLFEDFRENNLSYDDLFSALHSKVQQDPSFRHQAIPTLDQVQQRTPIPITHFIQLRSELDSAIENFRPTEIQQTPDALTDPDATLITALPNEHSRPNNINHGTNGNAQSNNPNNSQDDTLYDHSEDETALNVSVTTQNNTNNNVSSSSPTLIAKPTIDTIDDDDEATMIMPSGTLSGSGLPNIPTHSPTISSEDETVVNHPTSPTVTDEPALAETLVGKVYEQPENEQDEAETLVGTPINDPTLTSLNEPQSSTPKLASSPIKSSPFSVWVWAAAAMFIVLCSIMIAHMNNVFETTSDTEVASPTQTKSTTEQDNSAWGDAPGILQPAIDTEHAQKPSSSNTPDGLGTSDNTGAPDDLTTKTATQISQPVEIQPLKNKTTESTASPNINSQTPESVVKTAAIVTPEIPVIEEKVFKSKEDEIAYFVGQIKNAINANNLAPAEKLGTATYYLVKLIKTSPNSPFVSQARSKIAKAHLVLAATARKGERWDEAQQHLDDAFTVRLPDSYQSK